MRFIKCKHRKWEVLPSFWPYKEGWGLRCKGCKMILDTGLPKEIAIEKKKELEKMER